MDDDIFVRYIDMDVMIKEQVFANTDDSYTILINSRLNREQQLHSYLHAINHIINGDFDTDNDVDLIESRAHIRSDPAV